MFHHARTGDLAVLGDVTDQNNGRTAILGHPHQFGRTGAHLGDRAGTGLVDIGPQGLDGIDDDDIELVAFQRRQNIAQRGGRRQRHRGIGHAHALGTGPDLFNGLFAGNIGHFRPATGGLGGDFQQKGGLADPRITAQQNGRGRHHAAAAHTVELDHAGFNARRIGRVRDQSLEGDTAPTRRGSGLHCSRRCSLGFLDEGIPFLTPRAVFMRFCNSGSFSGTVSKLGIGYRRHLDGRVAHDR